MARVTIADVAKKAGVSKSTVSRIINGNHEQNTQETIDKVLKVIEELDYRPNALAKSLKSSKTNVIGIVLSNLQNPFWASVLEGVEDTCRSNGYNLMICNSNEEAELEEEHIRAFQMKQVDGIIINPTLKNVELYQKLVYENFPFVSINRKIYGVDVNSVTMNNVLGAKLAVEHLIKLNHKKIAVLVYPTEGISPRLERVDGYKLALKENGLEVDETLIRNVKERKEEVKKEVEKLFESNNRPDAIFSTNNLMTLEILEALKEMNLKVPKDVAVIGYDETVWSKHLNPPLTTVYQPAYKMGELAAGKIIKLINAGKNEQIPTEIASLEPQLIVRESCGSERERVSID